MVTLIALMASLFAGASAGIIGVASVAIRREERDCTLTSEPTGKITRAGRKLNGVYVRSPLSHRHPPVMTPADSSLVRLRHNGQYARPGKRLGRSAAPHRVDPAGEPGARQHPAMER